MGALFSSSSPRQWYTPTVEQRVEKQVIQLMDEVEREQYMKFKPSNRVLMNYYLVNLLCVFEAPLHWVYHIIMCILTLIFLVPLKIFCCRLGDTCPDDSRSNQRRREECEPIECCDYWFAFDQLHNTVQPGIQDTRLAAEDGEELIALAVEADTKQDTLDVATPRAPVAAAPEYLEPGIYLYFLRILEHHDYMQKAYGNFFLVACYNVIAPIYNWNLQSLVTYLSEDQYFVPLQRPVKKYIRPSSSSDDCCRGGDQGCNDCEEDVCFCLLGFLLYVAVALFQFLSCNCCCRATFCEHELVHCKSYKEMYNYRVASNRARTNSEILREYAIDRASAIGIGRRHPELFVRGLLISMTGPCNVCHSAKVCGPICYQQYNSFASHAQKLHNELDMKSKKATEAFYMEHFGVRTYEELLARERGISENPPPVTPAETPIALNLARKATNRIKDKLMPSAFRKKTSPQPEEMARDSDVKNDGKPSIV